MVFESLDVLNTVFPGVPIWVIVVVVIWSFIWKGFALWKAAAVKQNVPWFIVLLVVNTIGILEILYIYLFSEMGESRSRTQHTRERRRKKRR